MSSITATAVAVAVAVSSRSNSSSAHSLERETVRWFRSVSPLARQPIRPSIRHTLKTSSFLLLTSRSKGGSFSAPTFYLGRIHTSLLS